MAAIRTLLLAGLAIGLVACGGDDDDPEGCDPELIPLAEGDSNGHADPLGAGPGQARAGRINAAELPATNSNLAVWAEGDFVLANDRVALVIEDVGPSDLYDPWGGRPVGLARVEGGAMVEPADFGEFFILTGRNSVVTQSVTVLNDGSDGEAAVVRALGYLAPTPFFEVLMGALFRDEYPGIHTAIDYVLEPDAEHVDIYLSYNSPLLAATTVHTIMHAYIFTPRMPVYAPNYGFETEGKRVDFLAFVDDDATSYAYAAGHCDKLGGGIAQSGFYSNFCDGWEIAACAETRQHHSRITIGGTGLDGLLQAVARTEGTTLRAITGVVRDSAGTPAPGVRIHAENELGNYMSRAMSAADGTYAIHVDPAEDVYLTAWRRGDNVVGPINVASAATTQDFALDPTGLIHVTVTDADSGVPLPVRIQLLPTSGGVPEVPEKYGEPGIPGGRLQTVFAVGEATVHAPVGDWEVVVSRGYEYELHRETVTVAAGATNEVVAALTHVVDTTGVMCADFHIHTNRSGDAPDDAHLKVQSAVGDGLDIPVRSDHEYVNDFQPIIEDLGLTAWAFGMTSVELTTLEVYGHFGVIPIVEDPSAVNGGTPLWQSYPSADDPTAPLETLTPPELFAAVRARPEQPTIIINHPRGGVNYFDYVGYDASTGDVQYPEWWDEEFEVVEVFNGSSWNQNRDGTVADWLSFLTAGRRVFAVGSSDSHKIRSSPVGYPRTCMPLGTDDPTALDTESIRQAVATGHATVSGGIYVDARVGAAGPGDTVTGAPATVDLSVEIQAASWIAVDWIDLIVDGVTIDTIAVLPEDADAVNPTIRYSGEFTIDVGASNGFVIVAAWGNSSLEPVHPGRMPFAVTNPIFLTP